MRYLKYTLTSLLLAGLVASCDSINDPNLPIPLDETMSNTGAFLRILSVNSAAFDLAEPQNAAYEIEVEYFDGSGSTLLDRVEFFASYSRFTLPGGTPFVISELANPFYTITADEFSPSEESGLPSATISVPFLAILDAFGENLTLQDVGVEDRFDVRWVVHTTDGRSFTNTDAGPDVASTSGFYASPYFARVSTVQRLGEDEFVGTYTFQAQNTGVFGWWTFTEEFEAVLSVNPDNTLNGRIFSAEPYADDWGGLPPITVPIALGRTASYDGPGAGVGTGLGCSDGLAIGPLTDDENLTLIDINDDSQFTLIVSDNIRSDCATGPVDVVFTVTKN